MKSSETHTFYEFIEDEDYKKRNLVPSDTPTTREVDHLKKKNDLKE